MVMAEGIRRPLQVADSQGKRNIQGPSMVDGLGLQLSRVSVSIAHSQDLPPELQAAVELRTQGPLGPASRLPQQLVVILTLSRPLQAVALVDGEEDIEVEAVVAVNLVEVLVEAGARQTPRPLLCFG